MIFYIVALFLFSFSFFEFYFVMLNPSSNVSSRHNIYMRIRYASLFLFLILFCGLREQGVDRDYPEYLSILGRIPPFPDVLFSDLSDVHGDPILYFISSIINFFGGDGFFLFFIFAMISLSIYRWCFLKYSYLPWLSVFIYFCHSFLNKEMTQIRNGLSSALVLLMLCYISDKKLKKAFVVFFFSFLSHSSALVAFLLFFQKVVYRNKNVFYYVGFLFSLFLYFIWQKIFLLLPQDMSIVQKVSLYMARDSYNYSLSLLNPVLLRQFFYFSLFLYVRNKCMWNKEMNVFLFCYFLSICFYIAFNNTAILGARIANMLSCAEYILIPYSIVQLLKERKFSIGICAFFITIIFSSVLLYGNLEIKDIFNDYNNIISL